MTPYRRRVLVLAMLASAACALAQPKPFRSVSVSDARQLIDAIGPDRTIVLKKGDYRLETAYEMETEYVSWNDGDDGKELSLSKLQNLTIRGAEGARILSDSGLSSIIGIYDSKNVTLDNIHFMRLPRKGSYVDAGSLYAESVQGLTLDRCSFEGPTTIAIELRKCANAVIKRVDISGAASGALSAVYTQGLELSASRVSNCGGYPLLYLEGSDKVSFRGTKFEGSIGGNLIEIYAESGSVDSVRFEGSSFRGNHVEYFAGTSMLPTTEDCLFADNSFDENWESNSVAPATDDSKYSGGSEESAAQPSWYDHSSGLSFSYPQGWEMQEFAAQSRVGVFAPDGKSLVFFLTAYSVPARIDQAKQAKKIFADAYSALGKRLKDETGVGLSLEAVGEPYTREGLLSENYKGIATKGDGERAEARARLIIFEGGVHAMIGLAAKASSLEADGDVDGIFGSLEATAGAGE
jgi:Right handed beta helix region